MGALSSSTARGSEAAAALVNAALTGDVGELTRLLDGGASCAAQDPAGNHALGAACCAGHAAVVAEVLRRAEAKGSVADILELRNDIGTTPLWLAAGYGHVEIATRLIECGAAVDAPNKAGDTPLLAATSKGHANVVGALLRASADPATANRAGDTPLLIAASRSDVPLATLILDAVGPTTGGGTAVAAQAVLTATNAKRVTPLGAAASAGNAELVGLLCERADAPTLAAMKVGKDANGATPLAVAAFCKADAVVARLLQPDAGGALELADSTGNTPLWLAAASGSAAVVRLLLDAGAAREPAAPGGRGDAGGARLTPLEVARTNGHLDCVGLLDASA